MLQGLKTVIYQVGDLDAAKKWYNQTFHISPYFDEPFYVGFNVGGYELGLDPNVEGYSEGNHSITYWGVTDINKSFAEFIENKVKIHQMPQNVGGNIWTGSIEDPFGNLIGLIENPDFYKK